MLRRVYAHRVHVDGNEGFAISAPHVGVPEYFSTEDEFAAALDKLGFPPGFCRQIAVALDRRGIMSLDLEVEKDPGIIKTLGRGSR